MRCISPLLIRREGERNVVPCGKCNFCLQKRRSDWTFRLLQETKVACSAHFVTLTYDDESLPWSDDGIPTLRKKDYQLFKKRLRKAQAKYSDQKIRYYSVGEYGTETERPHYHSIMFNLFDTDLLTYSWPHGFVHFGDVTIGSIHYVTKYVINRDDPDLYQGREPPFALMSRRPAIGANYLDTHTKWHRAGRRNYTQVNGVISSLPRYYKEKIFTSVERQALASEAIQYSDLNYWEEIERLNKLVDNPERYYEERAIHAHESFKSKVNTKNKF